MFENLIGRFVIVEYVNAQERPIRTIAKLLDVKDGFLSLESPTKKEQYSLNVVKVVRLEALPPEKIDPSKIK